MAAKLREIGQELRSVLGAGGGRGGLLDTLLPPLLFVLLNRWAGQTAAIGGAVGAALAVLLWRLARGHAWTYALAGFGGVALAVGLVLLLGRSAGYFVPNLLGGVMTAFVAAASVLAGRPLVAWTSYLARRWPLDWYWHPRVRPAYAEVTWFWAVFSLGRVWLSWALLRGQPSPWVVLVTGWPLTVLLLILTYVYGLWRLQRLGGPSVDEFRAAAPPPWVGQRRGF